MEKNLDQWSEAKPGTLRSLLSLMAGIVTTIVGYGAWRSPHLDWESFINTFQNFMVVIFSELSRMMNDPFAFVGLIVMIVGLVLAINNLKNLLPRWF